MVDFNINSLLGNNSAAQPVGNNFDALLNLARGVLESVSQNVQDLINQTSFTSNSVTTDAAGIKVSLPDLADIIIGQQDVTLKTPLPIDQAKNFNIQVQNTNIVLSQGKPVLQLQGQLIQNNVVPQRFTAEIPLQSLANQNSQPGQVVTPTAQTADQVVRNFLPTNNITVSTNNLSETLRPALPQNLQNINLTSQNNFNIQIDSFTAPTGEFVSFTPNSQPASLPNLPSAPPAPQNIIQGQVEIFPDASEALIRTDFGTFRAANLAQLPNGSQINFTITDQATPTQVPVTGNILDLNPTNFQTLRLSLESADSPLQNLLKVLNSSQALAPNIQRYFPHPDDKSAYARSLMFLSGVNKGSPEGWLGEDGQLIINKAHESDTNLNRLQEVFGTLRNFSGHGEQQVSTEWNSYLIPLYDGNKLSFVTVQVQKDPDGKEQQTTKGKRKFILELEQDSLGRVAIEGLYSKVQGKVNNLDVVLKTENDVDDQFKSGLTRIFNDTAISYGFNGSLSFAPFTTPTPLYTDISKILGDGIII